MTKLLSANNPSLYLMAVLLSVFFHVVTFFSILDTSFVMQYREPASYYIFSSLQKIDSVVAWGIILAIGAAIQSLMAWMINDMINQQKINSKKTYFFSILYVLVSSLSMSWLVLSPQLISAFLMVMAVKRIFVLSHQEKFFSQLFDLGFIFSLSVLFFFPSVIMMLFILPALYSVRPFSVVEFLRISIGFLTPLFVVFGIYFLVSDISLLPSHFSNTENLFFITKSFFTTTNIALSGICIGWLALSGFMFSAFPFSINIKARKMVGVMGLLVLFFGLSLFMPTNYTMAQWLYVLPAITFFLGMIILEFHHRFIPNVIFASLLITNVICFVFQL
jgi:hypothetical protein